MAKILYYTLINILFSKEIKVITNARSNLNYQPLKIIYFFILIQNNSITMRKVLCYWSKNVKEFILILRLRDMILEWVINIGF